MGMAAAAGQQQGISGPLPGGGQIPGGPGGPRPGMLMKGAPPQRQGHPTQGSQQQVKMSLLLAFSVFIVRYLLEGNLMFSCQIGMVLWRSESCGVRFVSLLYAMIPVSSLSSLVPLFADDTAVPGFAAAATSPTAITATFSTAAAAAVSGHDIAAIRPSRRLPRSSPWTRANAHAGTYGKFCLPICLLMVLDNIILFC